VIVECAAYAKGARVAGGLDLASVGDWLDRPDHFVWLGLRMPDRDEMAEVAGVFGLEDLDVDDAVAPHDRPVAETLDDGTTWLVLRTVQYHPKLHQLMLGELCVLFTERFVITIRYGQASPLDGVRRELEDDADRLSRGAGAAVAAIAERVVDDYRPALDGFERDVLDVENEVFADSRSRPVKRLYDLKRQILELLVVSDALVDPIMRVTRTCGVLADPEIHEEMVLVGDQIDRITTRTRTLSDLITTAIEANLTQVSLQQNEDMRKISAWAAIALVPTAIAGIYGMNFEHMPELESHIGYPAVLLGMGLACFLLYRAFRRSGWL
jgi:magnesium transporter